LAGRLGAGGWGKGIPGAGGDPGPGGILVYCVSGGRASVASITLNKMGYPNVIISYYGQLQHLETAGVRREAYGSLGGCLPLPCARIRIGLELADFSAVFWCICAAYASVTSSCPGWYACGGGVQVDGWNHPWRRVDSRLRPSIFFLPMSVSHGGPWPGPTSVGRHFRG
jgi:hypothetical protein